MSLTVPVADGARCTSALVRDLLWYFPTMPTKATSDRDIATRSVASAVLGQRSRATRPPSTRGLAARYADVLYRPVPPVDVDDDGYPFRDHKPVEGTKHDRTRAYLGTVMHDRFRLRPEVCVGSDLGLFFERGNRTALLAPDLLITFGAKGRGDRLSYKVWEEGRVPDLCLEVLSRKTWRRDVAVKPGLYRDLGVREYWIVDTLGKLPTPIVGARLGPGGYQEVPAQPTGGFLSDVLGLELVFVNDEFRFRDPASGDVLPDYREVKQAQRDAEHAQREAQHAQREAQHARRDAEQRADAAEAELAALREQLRRGRSST